MHLYLWQRVSGLTNYYHDAGGVVIIAHSLAAARACYLAQLADWWAAGEHTEDIPAAPAAGELLTRDPDASYIVAEDTPARIWIFPDAGCC